jgi:hypothetical protein
MVWPDYRPRLTLRQSDGILDCGNLKWQYRLGPGHLFASPTADDARVYIASITERSPRYQ